MQLLTPGSQEGSVHDHGGGKALNLYLLGRHGFKVPPWVALGTVVFRNYRRASGIDEALRDHSARAATGETAEIARRIERMILEHEPDGKTLAVIEEAYRQMGGRSLAVRSSGVEEDSSSASFAGQFASYLNVVNFEDVVLCVQRCWASAYSERCLNYRLQRGIQVAEIDMAVILQELIPADRSGVIFTVNPVTSNPDELLISSVYGLGEGLVSGAVDADTITVDRVGNSITQSLVGDKHESYQIVEGTAGTTLVSVPESKRRELSLSPAEVTEVAETGSRVHDALGAPQDIEWAYSNGQLWVLQSRPVTAKQRQTASSEQRRQVWDKSSVSENFGDITTPLTFSVVRNVTRGMYYEHFRRLWIPHRALDEMDGWLAELFGYFNGRMYNNLANWVRTNRALPFSGVRRHVMQMQMGLADAIDDAMVQAATPFSSRSKMEERIIRTLINTRFVWRTLTVQASVRRFLKGFYEIYRRFEGVDYASLPPEEVYRKLREMEARLVPRFGSVLLLHPVISLTVGTLATLTRRWMPDAPAWFPWQAASPSGDVESVEPAQRLLALAAWIRAHPEAEQVISQTPPAEVYDRLKAAGQDDVLRIVDGYIEEFGYRSVNELKFEEPSFREDPSTFFTMLRDSLARGEEPKAASEASEPWNADEYIATRIRGWRRLVYETVRRRAQKCLRARERVRFCRTRAFGTMRTMFLVLGEGLATVGAIGAPRDIFYLTIDEIRGCFDASVHPDELKSVIVLRKRAAEGYRRIVAPRRFVTSGPVYWCGNLDQPAWGNPGAAGTGETFDGRTGELTGVPCSPGVAEGTAKLMDTPNDASGRIAVTYRTDPGWATVLPSMKALLVELGSPLNHVSIVARELGIPTVVQVRDLTAKVHSGMTLRVDGGLGHISVQDDDTDN